MDPIQKFVKKYWRRAFCLLIASAGVVCAAAAQGTLPPSRQATVRLEAAQQRKEGDIFFADGKVVIQYLNLTLRADHVQYNAKTYLAVARGHVTLDVNTQHLTADSATFNVQSGVGRFEHVRGEVMAEHQPNPYVLVSPNPLVFEAREVRRLDARTYSIDHAWLTICDPRKPNWKFFTSHATLHLNRSVALVNANFRLFRIPLIYLPYATVPAGRNLRQSGFLLPEFSDTSLKGIVLGEGYYWAPKTWTDVTLGGAYLSRRGWQQNAEFRAKPWENVSISAKYFGVIDRGLPATVLDSSGNLVERLVKQGGHSAQFELDAQLRDGWRAVADLNQLTSLTFQLAFAPTYGEAVNSEVRSSAFLTKSFHGFSANLASNSYENFLNAQPQVAVNLRSAPEARFDSVDQAPWKRLPIYFGGDAFAGAVHRSDEHLLTDPTTGVQTVAAGIDTGAAVERTEFAPRVVVPLRWGPWVGVTTSYTVRTTSYGAQMISGSLVNTPLRRTTGELNIDLRPPSLERVWSSGSGKWKHTIDPEIEYNYVRGVNPFDHFIRFDQDETLTDTNEFMYSITQRLFHRSGNAQANELASWKIAQKYYFDPTFNGALVPGTRNVFQALDSITPFAFADVPRRFSPIDSDLRFTPGGDYDAEIRLDYDTVRHKITTAGTLLQLHPFQNFNFSVAHFSIDNTAILQPLANQIRAQVGYGKLNRRGWNATFGFSYDVEQQTLQNQLMQISYNGSCCGIAFEYRRLALGPIRTENQFRVALVIANIGTFGNLRRQEKIY
ncbi:MAG TPA: LPS assembly protein LptD [Candidatus Dormibacteraeota bacterium]|nr:LPS assembly protein LptD [Candidatus Dormibacteraeota bacterium]